jgi:vancomycin resistance protein VanJ
MASVEEPDCADVARLLAQKRANGLTAKRRIARLASLCAVWLYAIAVVAVWLLMYLGGDRWWFATVVLFGPRWLLVIPLPLILPPAFFYCRRLLLVLLFPVGLILLGPIMGFCLPWGRASAPANSQVVRILTCNIDGKSHDDAALAALIQQTAPDVVALQECPADTDWPWLEGWHIQREGELFVASRYPLKDIAFSKRFFPTSPWPGVNVLYGRVETPSGSIGLCNLHLGSPGRGLATVLDRQTVVSPSRSQELTDKIASRAAESADAARWIHGFAQPLIIAGDFNMPTDSAIYRAYWTDYSNAFSRCGLGFGYSKWTIVGALLYGVRIDHVLYGDQMGCLRCWVGPDIGSDHLPVIAEFVVR